MLYSPFTVDSHYACSISIAAEEEHDEDEDTPASRFVARLLKFLLRGFVAKDKSVRFRSVYLVAEMVSHLGEIEYVVFR
jgi:condensin complex subunit 3